MSQKSPSKLSLLHSIENNNRTNSSPKSKHLSVNSNQSIGINTEQIQTNRDAATNTPNYAEQMAKAVENGQTPENIVQMLMQNDASEEYWKLVTQRRQHAIEETKTENQQLHNLIDELSKENDQLRILSSHCEYLQNVLNSFTNEADSLLDETSSN